MRPILLKIKGLNSFIEEQEIEFSKLMEPGLFGIFGPTGSGKTTILDGITLALYGEIARKSKNFVNTNCKSASVLFEFQISGAETKRYRVEREFKQDANREGYKTGKCRLSDITGEEPIILADKVTDVNNYCIEIIGLKSDDFQRTVVLPQGRFSEFLKLEGKKRSEMLERLFRLQPYGDGLTRKLKVKSDEISHKRSKLEGQFQTYAEISEDILKDKQQEVEQLKEELDKQTMLFKDFLIKYEEGKEIWNLQLDKEKQLEQKKMLDFEKDKISQYERQIESSEKANKVLPFIQSLEVSIQEKEKKENQLVSIKLERDKSEIRKSEIEEQYRALKQEREETLPVIRQIILGLKEAIDIQQEYGKLRVQQEKNQLLLEQKMKLSQEMTQKEKELREVLLEYAKNIEGLQEKQKKYEISSHVRQQIQTGISLEQQVNMLRAQIQKGEAELKKVLSEKEKQEELLGELERILFDNGMKIEVNLEEIQRHLFEVREKKKEYSEYTIKIKENENELEVCAKELENIKERKKVLLNELEQAKQEKEHAEIENLSFQLRQTLKNGMPCPVCGSVHHEERESHQVTPEILLKVKQVYEEVEKELREQEKKEGILADKQQRMQDELKQFIDMAKEREDLANSMNQEELDKKIELLPNYQPAKVSYNMLCKSVKEKEEGLKKEKEQYNESNTSLAELLSKVGFSSFQEAAKKLQQCDESLEKITANLKKGMELTQTKREELELCQKRLNQVETERAVIEENKKNSTERENVLLEKFKQSISVWKDVSIEEEGLPLEMEQQQRKEKQIEELYQKTEEKKEAETKYYSELQNRFIEVNSAFVQLQKQVEEENIRVNKLLVQEGFEKKDACLEAILPKDELQAMADHVEQYKNELAKNHGGLDKIMKQLNDRSISKEEWTELECKKNEDEAKCEELKLAFSNQTNNLKRLLSDWEKQKEIVSQLKKIEHQESLMTDLIQLFRGKKFVEYVAYSKLQYISKAASHRLRGISNGNYGLELDQSGKFMVCDYKNGGVKRDAFTLSGGETFLVSLSLSLALSEQVQLKGTAPLELFFLDEGFGTLDDELLEVVMSSLERIQNKHLTVGIISHVEAVKNRVPIKLIVSPSVAGLGGTKVHIEKN